MFAKIGLQFLGGGLFFGTSRLPLLVLAFGGQVFWAIKRKYRCANCFSTPQSEKNITVRCTFLICICAFLATDISRRCRFGFGRDIWAGRWAILLTPGFNLGARQWRFVFSETRHKARLYSDCSEGK